MELECFVKLKVKVTVQIAQLSAFPQIQKRSCEVRQQSDLTAKRILILVTILIL